MVKTTETIASALVVGRELDRMDQTRTVILTQLSSEELANIEQALDATYV